MTGRQVVAIEEMVGKIKAAVSARLDPDFVIIARTDARTNLGIDEALRRGKAFAEAGADVLFIESPESLDEMRLITSSFQIPVLANMVEGGRTPMMTAKRTPRPRLRLGDFPDVFNLYNGAGRYACDAGTEGQRNHSCASGSDDPVPAVQ